MYKAKQELVLGDVIFLPGQVLPYATRRMIELDLVEFVPDDQVEQSESIGKFMEKPKKQKRAKKSEKTEVVESEEEILTEDSSEVEVRIETTENVQELTQD